VVWRAVRDPTTAGKRVEGHFLVPGELFFLAR